MKFKATVVALCMLPILFTGCAKQENTPQAEQTSASAPVATEVKISPEQQAAIDSIDAPILDENNTDVPEEIANAPAEVATPETAMDASAATATP